jgi:hypothetical protein
MGSQKVTRQRRRRRRRRGRGRRKQVLEVGEQ